MRILLITQHFDIRGGSDVMVHRTAQLLRAAGHEVHLFAARIDDAPEDGIHPDGLHFERPHPTTLWKILYSPQARRSLDAFLDRHPVDVAHLHIHYGTLTSSILAPLMRRGIRIVQHLHEYRSFCSAHTAQREGQTCLDCRVGHYLPGLRNRCNRGALVRSALVTAEMYLADRLGAKRAPDLFVTVSDFQRDLVVGQGLPADRVRTIYNPVDPVFLATAPIGAETRRGVVFSGRMEDYKGVHDVLNLAALLPLVRFTMIGDGTALTELRARAVCEGLSNVCFVGALERSDIGAYLAEHRTVLVPSRWEETFGLTALEGMAAGLVPVVTRVGGLPEVVTDGVAGYVVESGDVDAMAAHVARLEQDDVQYATMSQAAYERAVTAFSEEKYRGAIEAALRGDVA